MKQLHTIFEGIFDTSQQSVSDAVSVEALKDPKTAFGAMWERIKSREPQSFWKFDKGVLDVHIAGYRIDNVDFETGFYNPLLPPAVKTIKLDTQLFLGSRGTSAVISDANFASHVQCPSLRISANLKNISFECTRQSNELTIYMPCSFNGCSFEGFDRIYFEGSDKNILLKNIKSSAFTGTQAIAVNFRHWPEWIEFMNTIISDWGIPNCTIQSDALIIRNALRDFFDNTRDMDDRTNILVFNEPKLSFAKLLKILGTNSKFPNLERIYIGCQDCAVVSFIKKGSVISTCISRA